MYSAAMSCSDGLSSFDEQASNAAVQQMMSMAASAKRQIRILFFILFL